MGFQSKKKRLSQLHAQLIPGPKLGILLVGGEKIYVV